MESMDLRFHIGVHRTGSTRLQKDLNGRRKYLSGNGISVFVPNDIRRTLRNFISKELVTSGRLKKGVASAVLRKLESCIQQSAKNDDRIVVFSDEDFSGSINDILNTGILYSDISGRVKSLVALTQNFPTTFIICVRNYADFFASLYAHRTKRRPLAEFETYKKRFMNLTRRWPDLINEILRAAPNCKVIVFSFEAAVKNIHNALCHVVGEKRLREIGGDYEIVLESPSAAAVDALNARTGFRKGSIASRAKVLHQFPRGKFSKFDPWTAMERAELTAQYNKDLNTMASISESRLIFSDLRHFPKNCFAQFSMRMREAANASQ